MLIGPKSKGISLLELLLVLGIMAVLLVAAFSRYQRYQYEVKNNEVNKSVTLLQQALTEYFFQYCHVNEPSQPSRDVNQAIPRDFNNVKELLDAVGWSNRPLVINNPWGGDFTVAIKQDDPLAQKTGIAAYRLQVSTPMDIADESVETYKRALNASGCLDKGGQMDPSCKDKIFVWFKLPWYTTTGTESDLWIMKGSLMAFNKNQTTSGICLGKQKEV